MKKPETILFKDYVKPENSYIVVTYDEYIAEEWDSYENLVKQYGEREVLKVILEGAWDSGGGIVAEQYTIELGPEREA
jgi:hypothetical protein